MAGSKRFSLNKEDGVKVLIGLGLALAGAALTYLTELIPNVDFGIYTPIATGIFAVLVNFARKFLKNYTDEQPS